jgi:hypothetical protein
MESQQLMFMLTGYGSESKNATAQNAFKETIGKMIPPPIDPNDEATEQDITDISGSLTRKVRVFRVRSDLIDGITDQFTTSGWRVEKFSIDFEPALYYERLFFEEEHGTPPAE